MRRLSWGSVVLFFVLFVILVAVLVLVFHAVGGRQSLSGLISGTLSVTGGTSERFTDGLYAVQDDWSSIGDFLSFVFGIPTALAGSVVAILLAQKAYEISRMQSDLEARNYMEAKVKSVVEHYWALGISLHDVDRLMNAYVIASVTEAFVINSYLDIEENLKSNEIIEEARSARLQAQAEFWSAVSTIGTSLRSFYRDSLALSLWNLLALSTDKEVQKISPDHLGLLPLFEISQKPPPQVSSCRDISFLANHFLQPVGFIHHDDLPAWLLATFLSQDAIQADIARYHADVKDAPKLENGDPEDFDNIVWSPNPSMLIKQTWKSLDAYKASQALRDPVLRLKLLGAIIGYRTFESEQLSHLYNEGLMVILMVVRNYPTAHNHDVDLMNMMTGIGLDARMTRNAVEKLKQHNIPEYLPDWMRKFGGEIIDDAAVVAYFNNEIIGKRKAGT